MSVNFKVKVDLDFPIVSIQNWLMEFAEKIVIPDIHSRMESSKDVNNNTYEPLAESTKRQRQKKAYGFQPLLATNELKLSIKARKHSVSSIKVVPRGTHSGGIKNDRLAEILQIEGVKSKRFGRRKFNFFAISGEVERDSIKFMEKQINKAIDRGGRRTIR